MSATRRYQSKCKDRLLTDNDRHLTCKVAAAPLRRLRTSLSTAFTIDAARNIRFTTAIIRAQLVQQPINPLIATLKPQSNGPSYSNTTIGTLAVDEWDVTFGTARRGLGGAAARPGPFSLYQM